MADRILLIDDDPAIHRLAAVLLRGLGVELHSASDAGEADVIMRSLRPDLILLDFDLPGEPGLDFLQRIRGEAQLAEIPVIFVTASIGDEVIRQCFAAGASDYIQKPLRRHELLARVSVTLERNRMLEKLQTIARRDALTGLANRTAIHEQIGAALQRAEGESSYHFAVLFLDCDRFKFINDSLGHDTGDLLLKQMADRLMVNLRRTDIVAGDTGPVTLSRLGGDEFIVLLDRLPEPETAGAIAARLVSVLAEPYLLGQHVITAPVSIGVVCNGPQHATADHMLRDADVAMYEAKARGKNCHVMFDPKMQEAIATRLLLENDLRAAIGTRQIYLVYQPILSIENGRMQAVESLVRWQHPDRGAISPEYFIGVAEDTQLILPLGDWILDEACRQFREWEQMPGVRAPDYISVNVSPAQLRAPGYNRRVAEILDRHGMQPRNLQLEVTESMLMQSSGDETAVLAELRATGVRTALDDFGTGYSSLSCLHQFPFDVLKIDRSFISELHSERKEFIALVHAIISLAHNLGMECVAEGIETREQIAMLLTVDCTLGQGYLLGPPERVPAALGAVAAHAEHSARVAAAG
ncbi:MAG: EAL domain-containing protein [Chromatiales bacterium]|nr:EAL domain-containing protein [Chromatiales bacterium]